MKKRYNERDTIDPIILKEIDESNEWLIGRMNDDDSHDHVDTQDDLVFDDDDLTWGDVARQVKLRSLDLILGLEQAQAGCHHQGGMTQLEALDSCLLFH